MNQRLDGPAPQEIDHVRPRLGLPHLCEVALAAGLAEDRVALPHVYKAHDQRARGRRLGPLREGQEPAAGGAEEE